MRRESRSMFVLRAAWRERSPASWWRFADSRDDRSLAWAKPGDVTSTATLRSLETPNTRRERFEVHIGDRRGEGIPRPPRGQPPTRLLHRQLQGIQAYRLQCRPAARSASSG